MKDSYFCKEVHLLRAAVTRNKGRHVDAGTQTDDKPFLNRVGYTEIRVYTPSQR